MDEHEKTTQTAVEDLTINERQAEEVKAGAQVDYFLKLQGVDGDISSSRSTPSISEITVTKTADI